MKSGKLYDRLRREAVVLRRRAFGEILSENIFFLHIPKCGGTSLDAAITEAFGWNSCLHLDSLASRKASDVQNQDLMQYRNSLLPYFMEQSGLKYICGHFVFNEDIYIRYSSRWRYITLLREPVQKYLSQYFFNLQKDNKQHFGIDESLEQFIESEEGVRLGQDMVQKISGSSQVTTANSPERKEHLHQAIQNIEKFNLVGVLEDLKRFETDFNKKFGVPLHIKRKNRNIKKDTQLISPAIKKKITSLCAPDIALYNHVLKMLGE